MKEQERELNKLSKKKVKLVEKNGQQVQQMLTNPDNRGNEYVGDMTASHALDQKKARPTVRHQIYNMRQCVNWEKPQDKRLNIYGRPPAAYTIEQLNM